MNKIITVRSRGKIRTINTLHRGKGTEVAHEFLDKVSRGFVKYSSNYMKLVEESPFAFREKQLNSILAPALAEFSKAFLMEFPINRKNKKLDYDSHGWVDYWAYYKSIDFYLELKHSYASLGGKITNVTLRRWESANCQAKDCIHSLPCLEGSRGFMSLSIQIIPIYETVKLNKEASSINDVERLINIQNIFHEKLEPRVNWSFLWIVHENLANKSYDLREKNKKYYPAVLIVANVSTLKK